MSEAADDPLRALRDDFHVTPLTDGTGWILRCKVCRCAWRMGLAAAQSIFVLLELAEHAHEHRHDVLVASSKPWMVLHQVERARLAPDNCLPA